MGLFNRLFRGSPKHLAYPSKLNSLIERAMQTVQILTATHDRVWQIGTAAWSVDQETGTITFTSPEGIIVTAPVQIIGTYNTKDGSWLWGWSNTSIAEPLTEATRKVQALGNEQGFEVLTTPKLVCSEDQCWELAALACLLSEAQGVYRGPAGTARVFMTFGQIKMQKAG